MSEYRKLFHESGMNHYDSEYAETDPANWPDEWKTDYYKTYRRFKQLKLSDTLQDGQLYAAIAERRSRRDMSGDALSLDQLATLLRYSCGEFIHPDSTLHRAQPSGGNRHPIEVYVLVLQPSDELAVGVYHYNIKSHSLEWMWGDGEYMHDKKKLFIADWCHNASALVVMSSIWWRTENKYNERGSRYAYIEAGHIAQNLHLVGQELGLKSVGLGGVWDDHVEELLSLDTRMENLIHTVALGK